jgi:hypothetical protein
MTLKHKIISGSLAFVAIVFASSATTYRLTTGPSTDGLPPCVAGQDEICAPAQWVKSLDRYNELTREAQELGKHLNAAVPGGYHIDQATMLKFLKDAPKPQPVPPPVPEAKK